MFISQLIYAKMDLFGDLKFFTTDGKNTDQIQELMKLSYSKLALLMLPATLLSCTWVDLSEDGSEVELISIERAGKCEKLGATTVSVLDNVGPFSRKQTKVEDELVRLARNQAALMEGNALAAAGEVIDGMQMFEIYRCDR